MALATAAGNPFNPAAAEHPNPNTRPVRRGWIDWGRAPWVPQLGRLHQHSPRPVAIPRRYYETPCPAEPPIISIVTPSLNQGRYLERTIRSVLDQRYSRLEYVIEDGGSADDSCDIVRRFGERLHHWQSGPDAGQASALNRGFRHASGSILAYLNADDVLLPGSLAAVASFFSSHPEIDVVYGQRVLIDGEDREIGRWILPSHSDHALVWQDFVPQETLFWRRRLWDRVGGAFDESFHFALDWELLLRFRRAGARFARLPRFLGGFRVHPEQKTSRRQHDLGRAEVERLQRREHGRVLPEREIHRRVRPYLLQHLLCSAAWRIGLITY